MIILLLLLLLVSPLHAQTLSGVSLYGVSVSSEGGGGAPGCTASYGNELATTSNAVDCQDNDCTPGSETDAVSGFGIVSSPSVWDSVDTAPHSGTYHISATADSNGDGFYRLLALSTGTIYAISAYVRHNGVGDPWACTMAGISTYADVALTNSSAEYSIESDDVAYDEYRLYFLFNTGLDTITCKENGDVSGGVYFDSLSIKTANLCYGSELFVDADAASIGSEANAVGGFVEVGSGTLESSATSPDSGSYSIHFVATADGDRFYIDLNSILASGTKYMIRWKQKYVAGDAPYCGLFAATTLATSTGTTGRVHVNSNQTAWTDAGFSFTYDGSAFRYFGCRENGVNNNAELYIDSISIKEITGE